MRTSVLATFLLLGCTVPHKPCLTTVELGVWGSQSDGRSTAVGEQWENDDVTVGGSATLTLDLTGTCESGTRE